MNKPLQPSTNPEILDCSISDHKKINKKNKEKTSAKFAERAKKPHWQNIQLLWQVCQAVKYIFITYYNPQCKIQCNEYIPVIKLV